MTHHTSLPYVAGLLQSTAYAEPVDQIIVRETHISWVLLTGRYAYKIKKPVNLGFVDFTTLEKRRHFCEEELRLNSRYSSDLYLDVISITGSPEDPKMAGPGPAIEVALRMRQFNEKWLLSNLLAAGEVTREMLAELARGINQAHQAAPAASLRDDWGSSQQILKPITENFVELQQGTSFPARKTQLQRLEEWSLVTFEQLRKTFDHRQRNGHVRECHGDLHLGNIVVWRGHVTPFDCIEFNPAFRWIDTMSEVAFVVIDLDKHGRYDLAACFLNRYLEQSGDYSGLSVLRFYLVYRAVVRAKVELLRLQQIQNSSNKCECGESVLQNYLDLATRSTQTGTGRLIITHGLSGSGKTWGTESLIESLRAIRIRSDVERKRIYGITSTPLQTASPAELYSAAMTQRTYDRLAQLARELIQAGFPVIVDATFLHRADRTRFLKLARELNVAFQIISFEAEVQVLRERIQQRARAGQDASDATIEVMETQRATYEPLDEKERAQCVTVNELMRDQHLAQNT